MPRTLLLLLPLLVPACDPPKPPAPIPAAATATAPASAPASVSAPVSATAIVSAPAPASASPTPCPPEAPQPAGALAWVSGCKILIAEKIVFGIDKSHIKPKSYAILDAVGDILTQSPDLFIEIQGHLGEPEPYARSRRLSQDRADAVRRYLIEKKAITPERLEAHAYGASMPIADWKTEEGRKQNRRIEFVIWKWRGGTTR